MGCWGSKTQGCFCATGVDRGSPPPPALSCNFERDQCAWFMEQDDGFEWERRESRGWGVDHTTGSGKATLGEAREGGGCRDSPLWGFRPGNLLCRARIWAADS